MSSESIKIDDLAKAVMKNLEEYKDLAADKLKKVVKRASKTVVTEISANAPVKTGVYAKSWKTKTTEETPSSISITVYSPKRYMLAHLLEKGHAKRGGGRVRAFPHIAPAEQKGAEQLQQEIIKALASK